MRQASPRIVAIVLCLLCRLGRPAAAAVSGKVSLTIEPDRVMLDHTNTVTGLAFFPDSARVASSSADKTVKVWNVLEGRVLRTLEGHANGAQCVAVSPDGKFVASGGGDMVVRVWDPQTGDLVGMLEGHTGPVRAVAFVDGGRRVVSGSTDGLRCWDWEQEKLIWRSTERPLDVLAMAVSRDGARAAVCAHPLADVHVWDLKTGTRLHKFNASGHSSHDCGISPDGKEVFGHAGPEDLRLRRWDAESGRELEIPHIAHLEQMAWLPDGSAVFIGTFQQNTIFDARTWTPLRTLGQGDVTTSSEQKVYVGMPRHQTYASAVSPDGRTIVTGTGGRRIGEIIHEGMNAVFVYTVPPSWEAAKGPLEGRVSWETITAKVRTAAGAEVPLQEYQPRGGTPRREVRGATRIGDGLDAFWMKGALLLHSEPGVLREVMNESTATISDVVADGRHVWVATLNNGILIFDRDGNRLNMAVAADGLPAAGRDLLLYPLAAGRVLAVGVDKQAEGSSSSSAAAAAAGTGFCALVEWDGSTSSKPTTKVLFKEDDLPDDWKSSQTDKGHSAMEPLWIGGGPDEAWVAFDGLNGVAQPILRVNRRTLAVAPYNYQKPQRGQPRESMSLGEGPAYWRDGREVLLWSGGVHRQRVGEQGGVKRQDRKLVCDGLQAARQGALLEFDGRIYAPGVRWRRIDPRTLDVEDLGPGMRVDGVLVDSHLARGTAVEYFVSGVLGPAAISKKNGLLVRFSFDPAKPLAERGTGEPLVGGRDLPPDGRFEPWGLETLFMCGQGLLQVGHDGKLDPRKRSVRPPWKNPREALEMDVAEMQRLQQRINAYPEERERLGLNEAQVYFVRNLGLPVNDPSGAKLHEWHTAFMKAKDWEARKQAAKPLLAEAKRLGDLDAEAQRAFVAQFKGAFSPRQWKTLHNLPVGPSDDATIPKLKDPPKVAVGGSAGGRRPGPTLTYEQRMDRWVYLAYAAGGLAIVSYVVVKVLGNVRRRKRLAAGGDAS